MKRLGNRLYRRLEDKPATATLAALALGGVATFLVLSLAVYSNRTYVAKTACSRDPSSSDCARLRQEVARAEPIENPCISHQRVEGTKGRNCPRFYLRPQHHAQLQANSKKVPNLEVRESPPASASPLPAPGGGSHDAPKPPKGGTGGAVAPGKGGSKGGKEPAPQEEPEFELPSASAPEASTSAPPPPEDAGNSDDTPAAENSNGVKACIDLAVSACVKSEVEVPLQLPQP